MLRGEPKRRRDGRRAIACVARWLSGRVKTTTVQDVLRRGDLAAVRESIQREMLPSAQEVNTCRKLLEADERELRIVGKAPYTEVIKANRSRSERGRRVGLCLAGWPVVVP